MIVADSLSQHIETVVNEIRLKPGSAKWPMRMQVKEKFGSDFEKQSGYAITMIDNINSS